MSVETYLFYELCQKYREASPIQSGDAYDDIVAYVDAQIKSARQSAQNPVGELRCDATTGHVYGIYWIAGNAPPIGTKLYTSPVTNSDALYAKEATQLNAGSQIKKSNDISYKGLELEEKIQSAFAELALISPHKAVAIACGILVGIVEHLAELHGVDRSKEIKIDGNGESRDITIHPHRKQS
jgi:hypothetical protein